MHERKWRRVVVVGRPRALDRDTILATNMQNMSQVYGG